MSDDGIVLQLSGQGLRVESCSKPAALPRAVHGSTLITEWPTSENRTLAVYGNPRGAADAVIHVEGDCYSASYPLYFIAHEGNARVPLRGAEAARLHILTHEGSPMRTISFQGVA